MKFLVEWDDISDARLDCTLVLTLAPASFLIFSALTVAHKHVELCEFVRILARGGHLDRASPVEVAVTQGKGQLLDLCPCQDALVKWNEAMGCQDTALSSTCRSHEEVKWLTTLLLSVSRIHFDEASVNDAATWWILKLA